MYRGNGSTGFSVTCMIAALLLVFPLFDVYTAIDDKAFVVQVELAAKSETPTLKDIVPYRDALVVYEYRVRKNTRGDRLRVAHWAIYDNQPQKIIKEKIGSKRNLLLRPFHKFKALEDIYISDTLEIQPDLPFYHDVGQKILFNQSAKKRYDYRCSLSDTMPAFWMLKDQLRLVVLGDSRGMEGVRSELFYGEENQTTPVSYNLSASSAPLEFQEILVKDYLLKLPRLKWVVYQMSPRVVNHHYNGSKHRELLKSPGYKFDREHAKTVWKPSRYGKVTDHQLSLTPYVAKRWKKRPWGWKSENKIWDKPKAKKWKGRWKLSSRRWEHLEAIVKVLDKRGIRTMLYLSPIHPIIRKVSVVDDDGTSKEGYRELVRRLKKLDRRYPNLVFVDLLKGGNHDFGPELFGDLDHLNEAGAAKLTRILETVRQRND